MTVKRLLRSIVVTFGFLGVGHADPSATTGDLSRLELIVLVLVILFATFVCWTPVFTGWARKIRRRPRHRRR